jgi:hypothetical protein
MDILLVLGSVTAKQSSFLRFAMLKHGLKPRIVRVNTDMYTDHDFDGYCLKEIERNNIPESQMMDYFETRTAELKQTIVNEAFGERSLVEVKAVLREPLGDHEDEVTKFAWLTDDLEFNLPDYTVMTGNDGSYWLEGAGYGHLVVS